MKKHLWPAVLLAGTAHLGGTFGNATARADVRLPRLVADGMVLQQKTPVHLWGWADNGEKVTVKFQDQEVSATAADGRWSMMLRPLRAGGPHGMTIQGNNRLDLLNVLVGEVWVASGQSNMEWSLGAAHNGAEAAAAANDPFLRMFTVTKRVSAQPEADVAGGRWEWANPQNAGHFSAVGYFFAQSLRKSLGVPVGVIHTSWGGTHAEAWASRPALEALGTPAAQFERLYRTPADFQKVQAQYNQRLAAWKAAGSPAGPLADAGNTGFGQGWARPETGDEDWATMNLPQPWETGSAQMGIDGAVWFRREVEVPAAWNGQALKLSLGAIDDLDVTYFNGVQVGQSGAGTPNVWQTPRNYTVPANLVKAGRNVIAVRVWDQMGGGGLTGPAQAMRLAPEGAANPIDLSGPWRYKVEVSRVENPGGLPNAANPNAPSGLFNAMLAPVVPFTIKGAIWYQGESNAGNAKGYRTLFPGMISNWRSEWKQGPFPFLLVQLAPFMDISPTPQESGWAELREAQTLATKVLPNVGMAVITDVGEEKDIHPRKKQPVGERLALQALKIAYNQNIVASGPTYKSMEVAGDKVILHFDNVGSGLEARGDKLTGFAIAGADGKFVWADAAIQGGTVVVSSPAVPEPKAVRYGWANYPVVNLWNKNGLPANPFRTDQP